MLVSRTGLDRETVSGQGFVALAACTTTLDIGGGWPARAHGKNYEAVVVCAVLTLSSPVVGRAGARAGRAAPRVFPKNVVASAPDVCPRMPFEFGR